MSNRIDWKAVHDNLSRLGEFLAGTVEPPGDERRRALRARARMLSREGKRPMDQSEHRRWLILGTGEARCALPLDQLGGVINLPPCTPLPESPLRLFTHRGEFWSLASLGGLLGGEAGWTAETESGAVLLRHPEGRLALACPPPVETRSLPGSALTAVDGAGNGFVSHFFREGERHVAVINVDGILADLVQTEAS